jgi:hypothetical protein
MNGNNGLNTVGLVDINERLKSLIGSIIGGRMRNGDKFSGLLIGFDETFLQLEGRTGKLLIIRRSGVDSLWGV